MEYSRNYIFVWLDKHEKDSRVRYFVEKCVEDGHMAKSYEPLCPINRVLSSPLAIPWHKRSQVEVDMVAI